jgi:3-deoxy-D-manno-octulosonic-acid transferase
MTDVAMSDAVPATLRLYRTLTRAMPLAVSGLLARRIRRGKEDPARIGERRGMTSLPRPDGQLIWVHGASVGEVLAVATLIERLQMMNFRVLLTSGSVTSAQIIAKRFSPAVIHQFIPYDSPRFVERFLDHWKPNLAIFVESDLWPNFILAASERRVPMMLVNGRLSERSFARWRKVPGTIGALLGRFDLCLAQSEGDAARLADLGAPRVQLSGNLKLDVPAPPADDDKLQRLTVRLRGRPVVVAASTHPGEDDMLLEAHRRLQPHFPELLTVLIPRHPHRGPGIAQQVTAAGLGLAVRSRDELPTARTQVYLADTMGELGLFYRLAPIVFMGGSLVTHGGQNPIEALKLGAAILHGINVWNFGELYAALDRAGGAVTVADETALTRAIGMWLSDPAARQRAAASGLQVVQTLGGALERTMAALEPYLLQLRIEGGAPHA